MPSHQTDTLLLKLAVTKGLIDKSLAKEIFAQARSEGRSPEVILVERSNFLPVVVLGPTKVSEQHRQNSERLWEELLAMLDRDSRFVGIPIIGLRSVEAIAENQFATGHRQRSIDLLSAAYQEIRYRIQQLQR